MKLIDLQHLAQSHEFHRTEQPITIPIVIHGVPGCGKSRLITEAIQSPDVQARTLGAAYGDNLANSGVLRHSSARKPSAQVRILDEYQLGPPSALTNYNVVIGDPYQGPLRLPAHYVKRTSYRVPLPVSQFLRHRKYEIVSERPGTLITRPPYLNPEPDHTKPKGLILHLGPISERLLQTNNIPSRHPRDVQGLEAETVTLVYHSHERGRRPEFYVGCTRATTTLILISDEFHELCTTN